MLFHVEMTVNLPPDMPAQAAQELKAREKNLALELQRSGKWVHLWRLAGYYANISVFDVDSPDELHELLTSLPLFPYMHMHVRALCPHGSALAQNPA
jgi:muconolactone D-isomerase